MFIKALFTFMTLLIPFTSQAAVTSNVLSLPIQVQAVNEVGTSQGGEKNIFNFIVSYNKVIAIKDQPCHILYYVDNRYETEFIGKILPFIFKRNVRGFGPGKHEVRIDIIDDSNAENILGRAFTTINVF